MNECDESEYERLAHYRVLLCRLFLFAQRTREVVRLGREKKENQGVINGVEKSTIFKIL